MRTVDELWKAVILDISLYSDLQLALGYTLNRPAYHADNDPTEDKLRLQTLRSLYVTFFKSQPLVATASVSQQTNTSTESSAQASPASSSLGPDAPEYFEILDYEQKRELAQCIMNSVDSMPSQVFDLLRAAYPDLINVRVVKFLSAMS